MGQFAGWNIWGNMAAMLFSTGINMLLNVFFGPVVNAARGIAYQVTSGLQGLVVNISTAIRPQMVQSYAQGNHARTINLMYSLSKASICFLYIVAKRKKELCMENISRCFT
jgi:O-antigen/teichoic acid export membrane protein